MGIKKAKSKEIKEVSVSPSISTLEIEKMYLPPVKKAEMIEGDASQIAQKLIEIFKDRGLI
jgi:electron transfer flavoprotein beta subunit